MSRPSVCLSPERPPRTPSGRAAQSRPRRPPAPRRVTLPCPALCAGRSRHHQATAARPESGPGTLPGELGAADVPERGSVSSPSRAVSRNGLRPTASSGPGSGSRAAGLLGARLSPSAAAAPGLRPRLGARGHRTPGEKALALHTLMDTGTYTRGAWAAGVAGSPQALGVSSFR